MSILIKVKTYTTVIFDIGGVMITPSEKITPFILSQIFGIPLETALTIYGDFKEKIRIGDGSLRELIQILKTRYLTPADTRNVEQEYGRLYQTQAVINTAVKEIVQKVSERFTTVAFSNMVDIHMRYNQERGVFDHFREKYISSLTGKVKPSPEAFDHMLGQLQVSPQECVYIDEKTECIDMGIQLGMTCYLFDTAAQLDGYLRKIGVL